MSNGSGGIVIRVEWLDTILKMTDEEKGVFLDCITKHVKGTSRPESEIPLQLRYFVSMACDSVDANRTAYQRTSEARSEAGKRGGEKSGESRRQKKNSAESQTVGETTQHTQPEPSYDINTFTEIALNRSFEDCG